MITVVKQRTIILLGYLLGGRSMLCFRRSVWKRLKLAFESFRSVFEVASSVNMLIIIDKNVDVCRALKADFLQNLQFV